jgi:hypothetical protein
MKRRTKKSAGLKACLTMALSLAAVSGCVYPEGTVYTDGSTVTTQEAIVVTDAPPPPIVEETVIAPGPGYVWVGGGWVWADHWVWRRGYWAQPPRPGAVWVPGRYAYRNGRHVYYRGAWRYQ